MKIASIFTDHMVLQREKPVAVWGSGRPGDRIVVRFAGQEVPAGVDDLGAWSVKLQPMEASESGRTLTVESQAEKRSIRLQDVLVGEVWLGSGQSNMWWPLGETIGAEAAIARADDALLRLFTVPQRAKTKPTLEMDAKWAICSSKNVYSFSGVAYYFARELRRKLGVPVGMIHGSWGGTRIEAWTSRAALCGDVYGKREVEAYERLPDDPQIRKEHEDYARDPIQWLRDRVVADPGNGGYDKGYAKVDFDDRAWGRMTLPSKWQSQGHGYSGVFWFRREIDVPAAWAGKDLMLGLGACDKHDTTYFNNERIGTMGWEVKDAWCTQRHYTVPGRLVRAGRNVITTRVYSYMTDGGMIGPPDAMHVMLKGEEGAAIKLTGEWRYKEEHNFGPQPGPVLPMGEDNANTPCILFDNMIRPLGTMTMRGAIWYQGESNAGAPDAYRSLFPLMIRDWREALGQEDLAFYFVQLANYTEPQKLPVESGWAELREAQMAALEEPGTGMAVIIDVGEANDIHPRNKSAVGERLAISALAKTYRKAMVAGGPVYRSHVVEGDAIRIAFDQVDRGLKTSDGKPPRGFAIAGSDGAFEWGEARIEGQTVVVRSGKIAQPKAVRYAWANNPPVNLYNAVGLPACPFRTDR